MTSKATELHRKIGVRAREIDPQAFRMSVRHDSPERDEAISRRQKALSAARDELGEAGAP